MALREFTARCAREDPALAGAIRLSTGCGRLLARLLLGTWSRTPTTWDPGALPRPLYASQAVTGYKLAGPTCVNCNFNVPLTLRLPSYQVKYIQ